MRPAGRTDNHPSTSYATGIDAATQYPAHAYVSAVDTLVLPSCQLGNAVYTRDSVDVMCTITGLLLMAELRMWCNLQRHGPRNSICSLTLRATR